jgi:hypothetical protein
MMNTESPIKASSELVHDFLNLLDNHSRGLGGLQADGLTRLSIQCTYLETILYRVCHLPQVQEELQKQIRELKETARAERERLAKFNNLVELISKGEVSIA